MIGSSRSYAIGRAHFQIAGGWRSLSMLCGGYLAIVATIVLYLYHEAAASHTATPVITGVAVTLALIVQTIVLIAFGALRIMGAVRMDLTTRMIESHRLMPIPSWRAVAGYMIGGTAHAIALALINAMLAYTFAAVAGASMSQLTMAEAVLVLFVLFVWSFAALGAFRGKMYGAIIAMATSGSVMGGYIVYQLLPGLSLLISPLMGTTIYSFSSTAPAMRLAYPVSFIAQAVFFTIFFAGACRAYRGTHATTFNLWQALTLLAAWCATSAAGIVLWNSFHLRLPTFDINAIEARNWQTAASILSAMVLAAVPLRSLSVTEPTFRHGRALARIATLCGITVMVTLIPLAIVQRAEATPIHFLMTAAIVAAHAVNVYLILRVMRRAKGVHTFFALIIPGLLLWLSPLVIEFVQSILTKNAYGERGPTSGFASSFSPVGLLTEIWQAKSDASPGLGLVFQMLVPVTLAVFVLRRRKVSSSTTPLPPADHGGQLLFTQPPVSEAAPARASS